MLALLVLLQPAGAGQALQCSLEAQVLMPRAPSRRSGSASSWVTVWQCQVLFTDDAARIRELQVGITCAQMSGMVLKSVVCAHIFFSVACMS